MPGSVACNPFWGYQEGNGEVSKAERKAGIIDSPDAGYPFTSRPQAREDRR